MVKRYTDTCKLFFPLRPAVSDELKELVERMLDKNPETRITVSEIKVNNTESSGLVEGQSGELSRRGITRVPALAAPSLGDGGRLGPATPGGGALHGGGDHGGGVAEQRQAHQQHLGCGESLTLSSRPFQQTKKKRRRKNSIRVARSLNAARFIVVTHREVKRQKDITFK